MAHAKDVTMPSRQEEWGDGRRGQWRLLLLLVVLLLTMFGQWSIWQQFILIVVHPGQG